MGLFGGGNSSSSNTTLNTDARVVGGENSVNESLNVSGSQNTITTTDHGAVSGSLALALKGVEGAQRIASETVAANGSLLEGSLKMASQQQEAFTSAVEKIKTSDVRTLIVAGLAVVAVVGVKAFKG